MHERQVPMIHEKGSVHVERSSPPAKELTAHTLTISVEAYLDVHEVINADTPQFRELLSTFLQETRNIVPFLALCDDYHKIVYIYLGDEIQGQASDNELTHHHALPVSTTIPIRVRDLNVFLLHILLFSHPLLPELFTLSALSLLTLAVR